MQSQKMSLESIVQLVNTHYKKNELVNPSFKNEDEKLIFSSDLFTYNILIDLFIIVISTLLFFQLKEANRLIAIAGIPIGLYMLWQDFESINKIVIDYTLNKITLTPKNILKTKKEFSFSEIFELRTDYKETKASYKRYWVEIVLKDKQQIILFDLNKEQDAKYIANILQRSILK